MENSSQLIHLFMLAYKAAEKAYIPYSNFPVGSALLLEDGSCVTGVNIENRSYGLTNCAERTAIFKAVSEGKTSFKAIAIATPRADYPVSPCGACRQVISEFMPPETPVVFGSSEENLVFTTIGALYPFDCLHELKKEQP